MADVAQHLGRMVRSFLFLAVACLVSGSAFAQLTSCAGGSVCYYVAIQPIDVCSSTGTGCAAFNNPQFNHTCPLGNPTAVSSSNPIGFVDPSTGSDITRKIWNKIGVDISYFPMKQWNNGGYQSVTLETTTSSAHFTQMTTTGFPNGTGTAPPLNSDAHVLNMFFINNLVPATSGTLYGFSWIGNNGIAISQQTFCPPYPVTPRYDTLAHELGHNLGLDHLDKYNQGFGTMTIVPAPAADLMTQGSDRTVPSSTSNALSQLNSGEGNGTADQMDCNGTTCTKTTNATDFQRGEVSSSGFLRPIGSSTTIGTATNPTTAAAAASVSTNTTTTATTNSVIYFDTNGPSYTDSAAAASQPPLTLLKLTLTIGSTLDFDQRNRVDVFAGASYVSKFKYDTGKVGDTECPTPGTECVIINFSPGVPTGRDFLFSQGILVNGLKKNPAGCTDLAAAPPTITYALSDGLNLTRQMTVSCSNGLQLAANTQTPGDETTPAQIDPVVYGNFVSTISNRPPACSPGADRSSQPDLGTGTCPAYVAADGDPAKLDGQLSGPTAVKSCTPSGSLAALLQKPNVTAYVPNGAWALGYTGIQVVPIEPPGGTPASIVTTNPVNSCASNSISGQTVCVANNTDVYLLSQTSTSGPDTTLTSGASATTGFTGGICKNCGVAINGVGNLAVITMGLNPSSSGIQFLDLANNMFSTPLAAANHVSEGVQWDPSRNLILSPNENGVYDLFDTSSPNAVPEYTNSVGSLSGGTTDLDSAAEDCATGIALASNEFQASLYIANLAQATYVPGPPGTWTAPQQFRSFPEFNFVQNGGTVVGPTGIAVAPGSHYAVVAGEFGGNRMGVLQLPPTQVSGVPNVLDYVAASLPNTPDGRVWTHGFDPHTVTAYVSPNDLKAYALLSDLPPGSPPTYLAVVDMTALLAAPRITTTTGSHNVCQADLYAGGCTGGSPVDLVASGIVKYVATH